MSVFTLTDRASTIPSNIRGCQSGTWSAGQIIVLENEEEELLLPALYCTYPKSQFWFVFGFDGYTYRKSMDQPGKVADQSCSWSAEQGKIIFPCPRSRPRIFVCIVVYLTGGRLLCVFLSKLLVRETFWVLFVLLVVPNYRTKSWTVSTLLLCPFSRYITY